MFEIRTDSVQTNAEPNEDAVARLNECRELHDWVDLDNNSPRPSGDGDRVTVAVMDSGISERAAGSHWWFNDSDVTKRHDVTGNGTGTDSIGHGTAVASVIAHNTPPIELHSVKIFGREGRTGMSEIREAYQWLLDHAGEIDVVNMSWGSTQDVPEINSLHEKLISEGVQDVVAAGNTGADGGSPATSPNAFSAGAVDENGEAVRFSSFDPDQGNPDIAAIGKNVVMARAPGTTMGVPLSNEKYVKASGTSFSAPYAAAAHVNALYSKRKNWERNFEISAQDIPGVKKDGAGILKLSAALGASAEDKTAEGSAWNFRGKDTVWIDADWLPTGKVKCEKLAEGKNHVDVRFTEK